MKRISLKEMLAMATIVTTCSVAYAAPEATIVMTWPDGLQEVDNINSIETEWSQEVNVNYDLELTLMSVNRDASVTGHFVDNGLGASQYVNIQLDEQVTEPGRYVLTIPEGALFDGATYDASMATNEATTIHYLIEESQGVENPDVTFFTIKEANPADGSTGLKELSAIETFWNTQEVSMNDKTATVTNANGDEVATGYFDIDWEDSRLNKLLLNIQPAITADGTYTVTIPTGAAIAEEGAMENEETVLTYTIGAGGGETPGDDDTDVTYNFNPIEVYPESGIVIDENDGMGMSNLSDINITFSAFPCVKEGYEFEFTNENGEVYKSAKWLSVPDPDKPGEFKPEYHNYLTNKMYGSILMVGLDNIPSGTYTLKVPKGVIGDEAWAKSGYTGGSSNEEFAYTWKYIAKKTVEVPQEVIDAPLTLEVLTITLPNEEEINLLQAPDLESIPVGTVFNILTNKNDYAQSLRLILKDNDKGDILWTVSTLPSKEAAIPSVGVKGEDGLFHFEKGGLTTLYLYEGKTYTLTIEAYENIEVPDSERIFLKSTEVVINGIAEGIEYSDVEILDVTPEVGTVFDNYNERSFTVVYSGPVEIVTEGTVTSGYIVAYEGTKPFESITSNEDKTEWTFTIPESELKDCMGGTIACNVVANDMEGRRVYPKYEGNEYNIDNYEDGYQQFVYNCYLGCPEVTVVPGAGIVKELNTFEFTCPEAVKESIGFQGIDAEGNAINIVVLNSEGKEIAVMDRNAIEMIDNKGNVVSEDSEDFEVTVVKLVMHLDNAVTAAGEYTLLIPAAYFMTGTEFNAYGNRPQEIKYTVDPTTGVAAVAGEGANVVVAGGKVVVAGAEGAVEVYAVNGAKVASVVAEGGNAVVALEKGVYVVVVNGKSVKVVL